MSRSVAQRPAAVVHVDLDGAQQIFRVHGWNWEGGHDPLFVSGMRGALELFERLAIRATLFVIAEDLEQGEKLEWLREAVGRGHEIASHSLTHPKLTALDPEALRREIFESRERIERKLGVAPQGFRAPGFFIDRSVLESIDEAGYRYDSSLFCTAHRSRPHRPLDGRALIELPLPGYRPLPFPFHASYGLTLGTWYFRLGLSRFTENGEPLVFLLHLTDTADALPAQRLHGVISKVYTISHRSGRAKRRSCERMLRRIGESYRFADSVELLETVQFGEMPTTG